MWKRRYSINRWEYTTDISSEKKFIPKKMYNAFKPGKLRIIISECIEEINAKINKYSKEEYEFLNEKKILTQVSSF